MSNRPITALRKKMITRKQSSTNTRPSLWVSVVSPLPRIPVFKDLTAKIGVGCVSTVSQFLLNEEYDAYNMNSLHRGKIGITLCHSLTETPGLNFVYHSGVLQKSIARRRRISYCSLHRRAVVCLRRMVSFQLSDCSRLCARRPMRRNRRPLFDCFARLSRRRTGLHRAHFPSEYVIQEISCCSCWE